MDAYTGPARASVLVAIPSFDGTLAVQCAGGLMQCQSYFDRPLFFTGMSNISLARNELVHVFVEKTRYEHLVMIDADIGFCDSDWRYLMQGDEEMVCCEYARKVLGLQPVKFGLGFTRVRRSVFEKIKNLMTDDGQERVRRFRYKSETYVDYFPNGVLSDNQWIGEDQGFFMWAALACASVRLENRTRLGHVGKLVFNYPQQVPGFDLVDVCGAQ